MIGEKREFIKYIAAGDFEDLGVEEGYLLLGQSEPITLSSQDIEDGFTKIFKITVTIEEIHDEMEVLKNAGS